MSNYQVVGKREGPVSVRNMRYGQCQKNHAIRNIYAYTKPKHIEHTVDGCQEFMASGAEGTSAALTCAACGCHRSFHQKVLDTEVVCECSSSSIQPIDECALCEPAFAC